jgi:hemoglobin
MSETEATTAYALMGGQETVDRLVDRFYDRMEALPEGAVVRAMHPGDLTAIRTLLKKYMGEWLGGPKRYTSERGHPMLRARHLPFPIGNAERDAWMLCMNGALDETVSHVEVREHVRAALANLAGWMRNLPAEAPTV